MNPIISEVLQQNQYFTIGFVIMASGFFIIKYISMAFDAVNNVSLRKINKLKSLNINELSSSKIQVFATKAYDDEVFSLLTGINANRKTTHLLIELFNEDFFTIKQMKLIGEFLQEKEGKLLIKYNQMDKLLSIYSLILFLCVGCGFLYLILKAYVFFGNTFTLFIAVPILVVLLYFLGGVSIRDFDKYKILQDIYPKLKEESFIHPESDGIEISFIEFMRKDIHFKKTRSK